jgi:hypothetical protein
MGTHRHLSVGPLVLLALLGAQGSPRQAAPPDRYHALVREFQDAQQAYSKAYAAARSDSEREQAKAQKPDATVFSRQFLDLAREKPSEQGSFEAMLWVLAHGPHGAQGDEALELLAASHLENSKLIPLLQRFSSSKSPAEEKLLRTAMEKSSNRDVQAHACYTLALLLTGRDHHAQPVRHRTTASRKSQAAAKAAPAAEKHREEIQVLYGRLLTDFRDIKFSRKKTFGDIALAALDKFKAAGSGSGVGSLPFAEGVGLEVGMIAPEIQGQDTHGMPMRLSDFRGKVVVLDFWGDW